MGSCFERLSALWLPRRAPFHRTSFRAVDLLGSKSAGNRSKFFSREIRSIPQSDRDLDARSISWLDLGDGGKFGSNPTTRHSSGNAMAKTTSLTTSDVGRKLIVRDGSKEREAMLVSLRRGGGGAKGWVQSEGQIEQKSIRFEEGKFAWLHTKGESDQGTYNERMTPSTGAK